TGGDAVAIIQPVWSGGAEDGGIHLVHFGKGPPYRHGTPFLTRGEAVVRDASVREVGAEPGVGNGAVVAVVYGQGRTDGAQMGQGHIGVNGHVGGSIYILQTVFRNPAH